MSHTALFVVDDCCASLFINCRTEKRPLGLTNDIHGGLPLMKYEYCYIELAYHASVSAFL